MIKTDKYLPQGDKSIGYPQISIRTNRTAKRTNITPILENVISIGKQYPYSKKYEMIKAIIESLSKSFGDGSFGHAWIIYFHSDKWGDYTSYAFHQNYGYVKNSEHHGTNDTAERKFHLERCVKIENKEITPEIIEKWCIPPLVKYSNELSQLMQLTVRDLSNGVYTPITNCSWFAGNLWNRIVRLEFEQDITNDINIDYYAEKLGLPFLKEIRGIGDPGMLAESINSGAISNPLSYYKSF